MQSFTYHWTRLQSVLKLKDWDLHYKMVFLESCYLEWGEVWKFALGGIAEEDTVEYSLTIAWAYWVLCPTWLAFLPQENDWKQSWWQHMCFEEFTIFTQIFFLFSFFLQKIKLCHVWTELQKKHFMWLWGTACWKTAYIIAGTGVQLTSHWCCLFITACYYMSRLFWSCHDWTWSCWALGVSVTGLLLLCAVFLGAVCRNEV